MIMTRPSCNVYYHGNEEPHLKKIRKNFINCHHGNLSIKCKRVRIVVNLFFFLLGNSFEKKKKKHKTMKKKKEERAMLVL